MEKINITNIIEGEKTGKLEKGGIITTKAGGPIGVWSDSHLGGFSYHAKLYKEGEKWFASPISLEDPVKDGGVFLVLENFDQKERIKAGENISIIYVTSTPNPANAQETISMGKIIRNEK